MTHIELVAAAEKWLVRKRFPIVVTELCTAAGEVPDALGIGNSETILIECKANRADFLSDKNKPYRREGWRGLGSQRYYFTEGGLLAPSDLPPKWGLLEVRKGRVYHTVEAEKDPEHSFYQEFVLLVSLIRRMAGKPVDGVAIRFYTHDIPSKKTATASVCPEEEITEQRSWNGKSDV